MEFKRFKRYYIVFDMLSALISWILFQLYWHELISSDLVSSNLFTHLWLKLLLSSAFVLLFWFVIYYATGYYNNVLRKLRLEDFSNTFIASLFGVCIIFFFYALRNYDNTQLVRYESFLYLFITQLIATLTLRLIMTSYVIKQEKKGRIIFNTIFIGHVEKIVQVWKDLNTRYAGHGHRIIGYIPVSQDEKERVDIEFEKLGGFEKIHDIVKEKQPEDIIIVLEEKDTDIYRKIIHDLNSSNVVVKVNPDLYPAIKGEAIISSLFRYPLIEVSRELLTPWQASLKQFIDIIGAILGIIISLPVSFIAVIAVKFTSPGPIFYTHERIGRFGKPFRIIKFRSMYKNAEPNGPLLTTANDPRITPVGRFMRRLKLDEIPNFYNVLRGEMSLVGPRPERKFFIDQIVKRAPEYTRLLKVKPGVTSWGQVKYGYAENVDEMIRRMRYDLLYMDNMSLYVDFQILMRTILTIVQGRSK